MQLAMGDIDISMIDYFKAVVRNFNTLTLGLLMNKLTTKLQTMLLVSEEVIRRGNMCYTY